MGLVLVQQPSFLGTGLAFPVRLDPTGSRPLVLSDEDLVKSDMLFMLQTNSKERPFLVTNGPFGPIPFGTRLRQALFMDSDAASAMIQFETKRCIVTWEPRVIYLSTTITQSTGPNNGIQLNAKTTFKFRATSRADNFVVPYLLSSPTTSGAQ